MLLLLQSGKLIISCEQDLRLHSNSSNRFKICTRRPRLQPFYLVKLPLKQEGRAAETEPHEHSVLRFQHMPVSEGRNDGLPSIAFELVLDARPCSLHLSLFLQFYCSPPRLF